MLTATKPRGATAVRSGRRGIQRIHLIAVVVLVLFIAAVTTLSPDQKPETPDVATSQATETVAPDQQTATPDTPAVVQVAPPPPRWIDQTVRRGDNLSLIFKRAGFSDRDMYRVVNSAEHGKGLGRLYPGQTIAFQTAPDGGLVGVRHVIQVLNKREP